MAIPFKSTADFGDVQAASISGGPQLKVRRTTGSAPSSLPYGSLGIANNKLYFGNSSNQPVAVLSNYATRSTNASATLSDYTIRSGGSTSQQNISWSATWYINEVVSDIGVSAGNFHGTTNGSQYGITNFRCTSATATRQSTNRWMIQASGSVTLSAISSAWNPSDARYYVSGSCTKYYHEVIALS